MINLLKLSEDKQRLLILIFLIFILFFVIVGYIGIMIKKIMKSQASRSVDLIADVSNAHIFKTEGQLFKFGIRKNWRMFYRQAWLPFVIMLGTGIATFVTCLIIDLSFVDIWSFEKGYMTVFYQFDFKHIQTVQVFFLKKVPSWIPILHKPTFIAKNIPLYIFVTAFFVGFAWFLICTQAYIARQLGLRKNCKAVFKKSLDINGSKDSNLTINPE